MEMSVEADPEAVEAVSGILSRVAPGGVSVESPFRLVDQGLAAQPDLTRPALVRGYVSALDRAGAARAVEEAQRMLGHLTAFGLRPIGELQVRPVSEEDWAHAWKQHFPVLRVGQRVVIRPTWRRYRASGDDVVLALDPGMAFGTGLHPTTRLCLAGIETWVDTGRLQGRRVLDVGSGSGILAICAARMGAAQVSAVDTDPVAVQATTANARLNGSADRVTVERGSVPTHGETFDLIVANLIATLLVTLAPDLSRVLRAGGRLLAGGVFIDREQEVADAFGRAGLEIVGRSEETDWICLEAERPLAGGAP